MESKKPIKVLRIINRLNLGGPTYNAAFLTKYLEPEYETRLLAGMKDDSEAGSEFITQNLGIEPIYVQDMHRSIHPIKDFKSFLEIRSAIKAFKPQIVHTHAAKAGAIGRLAALSCGVPVILHTFHGHIFHSYFSSFSTKVFLFIERYLAKRTSGIVVISKIQQKELCDDYKICDKSKAHIIPLGFDLTKYTTDLDSKRSAFRAEFGIHDDEIVISIIGRLVPIKNHTMFLEALAYLQANTNRKFRAMIVGDGEDRMNIEEKAKSLGLSFDNTDLQKTCAITFTSWRKDIDVINAGSDIVCLTSFNEGTPVSLIEAAAAGKPILTTNVGGIADFIEDGQNGFLVESRDLINFQEKLKTLVENDSLRNQFSTTNSQKIVKQFSYQRLVSDMRALYKMLLN
ncbi:MAG: glycosyltransferase [Chitinophagales bacterium]|nr:glycosyltransferase [Chitinophagales bacterium]